MIRYRQTISSDDISKGGNAAMPKKPLENPSESMFYVLMALAKQGESCGVEIARFAEERSRGAVRIGPGTLYALFWRNSPRRR